MSDNAPCPSIARSIARLCECPKQDYVVIVVNRYKSWSKPTEAKIENKRRSLEDDPRKQIYKELEKNRMSMMDTLFTFGFTNLRHSYRLLQPESCKKPNGKPMYLALPPFNCCTFLEYSYNNTMPRINIHGHQRSLKCSTNIAITRACSADSSSLP